LTLSDFIVGYPAAFLDRGLHLLVVLEHFLDGAAVEEAQVALQGLLDATRVRDGTAKIPGMTS